MGSIILFLSREEKDSAAVAQSAPLDSLQVLLLLLQVQRAAKSPSTFGLLLLSQDGHQEPLQVTCLMHVEQDVGAAHELAPVRCWIVALC